MKGRKGGRESRLEYEVGDLIEAATDLEFKLHVPVVGGGKTGVVDLLFPEINLAVELDPHNWHQDSKRDERKQRILLQSEFDILRIRNLEVEPVIGKSIEVLGKKPWDWALALSLELKRRGIQWNNLNQIEVSRALGKAFIAWVESGAQPPEPSAASVAPHLAQEFVSNLTRDGIGLDWLSPGAHDICLWRCAKRSHEWKTAVSSRAGKRKTGCRKCQSESRAGSLVTPTKSIQECYPELGAQFRSCIEDPRRTLEWIGTTYRGECEWGCSSCGYTWMDSPRNRVRRVVKNPASSRCPECGGS
ncbi:hypothetical protein Hesp01_66740 [Herbidospora sp. NBRC 101105]|nr:hypothetical protein Hesp01_66740 [Herbidospora sp. NBRC 101105]